MMRRVEFALLLAVAAAFAVGLVLLLLLLLLHYLRPLVSTGNKQPSAELPLSRPSSSPKRRSLLLVLCSRRAARVEPASANNPVEADASSRAPEVDDVARWRDRWFGGPPSQALYTIDEEDEERFSTSSISTSKSTDDEQRRSSSEPETPFYTPPASPPRERDSFELLVLASY